VPPASTATAGLSGMMVVDPTGETVELCEVPLTLTVRAANAAGSETIRVRESICWVSSVLFVVQCVADGNEAFLFVDSAHTRPALIFLDLVMPVLDGWGFLAERVKYPLSCRRSSRHIVGIFRCGTKSQASRSCGCHEQARPSRHRVF
jgi:CheY-like chemotaxis protein